MALRVGIVDFLNSWPLAWSFLGGESPADLEPVFLPPNIVAERLAADRLDVGLIPSIELRRIPGLKPIPGLCVAATREVRSVLLISRVPIASVRRVALDDSSRTSAALVRILLERVHGLSAEFMVAKADPDKMLEVCDAALVIGDPALKVRREAFEVMDLAAEWRRWTGLPFVFAVWAMRAEVATDESVFERVRLALSESLESGLGDLEGIVERAVERLGLERREVEHYLTRNLNYRLGRSERQGLDEYYRLAEEFGFIEPLRNV